MVSVHASCAVDRGFEPRSNQTKDLQLVFVASPRSTQHLGEKAKTGWLGIRISNVSEWRDMSIRELLFQ